MKEYLTLKQFKETITNYIEDKNTSLVSYGIKINHKYKQIRILTQDDVPKPFYQNVFEYILHFFSRSRSNNNESVLIIQFKPIDLLHQIECKEYAYALHIKNECISSKTSFVIIKRINRLMGKLKTKLCKKSPEVACKATFLDTLRYVFSEKYNYKHKSNGVNIKTFSFLLLVLISIASVILSLIMLIKNKYT